MTIHLGRPLPVASCGLPGGALRRTSSPCLLLGLAPDGVCRAAAVTRDAGELLPHRFTLTSGRSPGRFVFCGTFRGSLRLGFSPASCPMEPGLSSTLSMRGPRSPGLLPHPLSTERTTRFILRAARSSAPSSGRPSRMTKRSVAHGSKSVPAERGHRVETKVTTEIDEPARLGSPADVAAPRGVGPEPEVDDGAEQESTHHAVGRKPREPPPPAGRVRQQSRTHSDPSHRDHLERQPRTEPADEQSRREGSDRAEHESETARRTRSPRRARQ